MSFRGITLYDYHILTTNEIDVEYLYIVYIWSPVRGKYKIVNQTNWDYIITALTHLDHKSLKIKNHKTLRVLLYDMNNLVIWVQ